MLASRIGVSVPYLADVELERRGPLRLDRIQEAAEFLETDPGPLFLAAGVDRGGFELPVVIGTNGTQASEERRARLGSELALRWVTLDATRLEAIEAALR